MSLSQIKQRSATIAQRPKLRALDAVWIVLQGIEAAYVMRGGPQERAWFNALTAGELDTPNLSGAQHIYEGVVTMVLRLVFLICVEEEGLASDGEGLYPPSRGILTLYRRLKGDSIRDQEQMETRFDAWEHLLSLTRLIYQGGSHIGVRLIPRRGELFDPERFDFLEGRGQHKTATPQVSDACVYNALDRLLSEERRSPHRALEVEELGSIYESLIGYTVERATGVSVMLIPHECVISLDELLSVDAGQRLKWLKANAGVKFSYSRAERSRMHLLQTAQDIRALLEALESKRSPRTRDLFREGSLYLQPSTGRRDSGSHYTPQSLCASVVKEALRPHLEHISSRPMRERAQLILKLKVCDPAMGSGVFLIETCRQLADALVEIWSATDAVSVTLSRNEALIHARQCVAERCLYGVDRDPFAVSVAQLSLWLFTRALHHPLSWLDHVLRSGDALVGLRGDQLSRFTWFEHQRTSAPSSATPEMSELSTEVMRRAAQMRSKLIEGTSYSGLERAERLRDANIQLREHRVIADALVAIVFNHHTTRHREIARVSLAQRVRTWLDQRHSRDLDGAQATFLSIEKDAQYHGRAGRNSTKSLWSFHWGLEFPEVAESGFDCIVGNPPFVGGRQTTAIMGEVYQDWLTQSFSRSQKSADLCSYFFRQAYHLIRRKGTVGFVATKSIGEGTTKETGLKWICAEGGVIYHAVRRRRWPGRDAEVKVSTVHLYKGAYSGSKRLDGVEVVEIKDGLTSFGLDHKPARLSANKRIAFQGSITLGMGFTFDDQSQRANPLSKMNEILDANPSAQERIFPYLGGHELNTDPEHRHHRYVINFESMSLTEAERWPELLGVLKDTVYPSRVAHKNPSIRAYPWWQHWNRRETLYAMIKDTPQVLLTNAQAAAHLCFSFYEGRAVFANSINVINLSDWASFALLQSRVHEVWARSLSTHLGDQLRYNPTTCFETYPRPAERPTSLHKIGERYHTYRAQLMRDPEVRRALMGGRPPEGLTHTYNHFHRPDCTLEGIVRLRSLHEELDREVARAMGWGDLELTYEWVDEFTGRSLAAPGGVQELDEPQTETKPRLSFTPELRIEILTRLMGLNAEFAGREV